MGRGQPTPMRLPLHVPASTFGDDYQAFGRDDAALAHLDLARLRAAALEELPGISEASETGRQIVRIARRVRERDRHNEYYEICSVCGDLGRGGDVLYHPEFYLGKI